MQGKDKLISPQKRLVFLTYSRKDPLLPQAAFLQKISQRYLLITWSVLIISSVGLETMKPLIKGKRIIKKY